MNAKYQVVNGTHYHAETPKNVITVLEACRSNGTRIRVRYGDTKTGRDWLEEYDVEGRIGRSMGPVKVPLLLHNSRSMGGGAMLDHCIVRIIRTGDHCVLYSIRNYQRGEMAVHRCRLKSAPDLRVAVRVDGETHARFKTRAQAEQWVKRMSA